MGVFKQYAIEQEINTMNSTSQSNLDISVTNYLTGVAIYLGIPFVFWTLVIWLSVVGISLLSK